MNYNLPHHLIGLILLILFLSYFVPRVFSIALSIVLAIIILNNLDYIEFLLSKF